MLEEIRDRVILSAQGLAFSCQRFSRVLALALCPVWSVDTVDVSLHLPRYEMRAVCVTGYRCMGC